MTSVPSLFRVDLLPTARCEVVTVTRDTPLKAATTTLLLRDYSQLPVVNNNAVVGLFRWKSYGEANALGRSCERVGQCMAEAPLTVSPNDSLLDVVPRIAAGDVALVVHHSKLQGIITTSDLSVQFLRTIRPFVLLESIENGLRALAKPILNPEDIATISSRPSRFSKPVNDLRELTLGQLLDLFTAPDVWERLRTTADAKAFREHLDQVRVVRNAVMHFRGDDVTAEHLLLLESVERGVRLLRAHCDRVAADGGT